MSDDLVGRLVKAVRDYDRADENDLLVCWRPESARTADCPCVACTLRNAVEAAETALGAVSA